MSGTSSTALLCGHCGAPVVQDGVRTGHDPEVCHHGADIQHVRVHDVAVWVADSDTPAAELRRAMRQCIEAQRLAEAFSEPSIRGKSLIGLDVVSDEDEP